MEPSNDVYIDSHIFFYENGKATQLEVCFKKEKKGILLCLNSGQLLKDCFFFRLKNLLLNN